MAHCPVGVRVTILVFIASIARNGGRHADDGEGKRARGARRPTERAWDISWHGIACRLSRSRRAAFASNNIEER
eukprot:1367522-Pleurochrysis_carterae.AAC.1